MYRRIYIYAYMYVFFYMSCEPIYMLLSQATLTRVTYAHLKLKTHWPLGALASCLGGGGQAFNLPLLK